MFVWSCHNFERWHLQSSFSVKHILALCIWSVNIIKMSYFDGVRIYIWTDCVVTVRLLGIRSFERILCQLRCWFHNTQNTLIKWNLLNKLIIILDFFRVWFPNMNKTLLSAIFWHDKNVLYLKDFVQLFFDPDMIITFSLRIEIGTFITFSTMIIYESNVISLFFVHAFLLHCIT